MAQQAHVCTERYGHHVAGRAHGCLFSHTYALQDQSRDQALKADHTYLLCSQEHGQA